MNSPSPSTAASTPQPSTAPHPTLSSQLSSLPDFASFPASFPPQLSTLSGKSVFIPTPAQGTHPVGHVLSTQDLLELQDLVDSLPEPDTGHDDGAWLAITRKLLVHAFTVEQRRASEAISHEAALANLRSTLERATLEHALLQRQATTLASKLSRGFREKEKENDDLGIGSHEREKRQGSARTANAGGTAEEEKLRSDVRFLTKRLHEAEMTAQALENALKSLRAYLLHAAPLIVTDTVIVSPSPPPATAAAAEPSHKKRKLPLMGDAEAEHLLLAGHSRSHVRRIVRVPVDAAVRAKAREIVREEEDERTRMGGRATPPPRPNASPSTARRAAATAPSPGFASLLTAASSLLDQPFKLGSSGTSRGSAQVHYPAPRSPTPSTSTNAMTALELLASSATSLSTTAAPLAARDPASVKKEKEKSKRSPYVKWNVEEDENLVKAVLACGQRWDQVAALVPTRSYHQCRQRWLRGLRSGDSLPSELKHYKDSVKESVRRYEASRAKNKISSIVPSSTGGPAPSRSASGGSGTEEMGGAEEDEDEEEVEGEQDGMEVDGAD